jgi:hypothetical protein
MYAPAYVDRDKNWWHAVCVYYKTHDNVFNL